MLPGYVEARIHGVAFGDAVQGHAHSRESQGCPPAVDDYLAVVNERQGFVDRVRWGQGVCLSVVLIEIRQGLNSDVQRTLGEVANLPGQFQQVQ